MRIKPLSIFLIISLGLIVYSNTFFNSFHFDDYAEIIDNAAIKDVHHWHAIWNCWPTRFISYFSFALNYHWGGLNVVGYHIVSLALHLGACLLVWWLTFLTLQFPSIRKERIFSYAPWISLFAALIFLVHPLQTQPVNYIFQRAVLLAAFFYLGALILYIKARVALRESPSLTKWKFYYCTALVWAVLSIYSKETAVTLPLMVCLYEFCFLKDLDGFKWKMVIPFFGIFPVLAATWLYMHPEILQGVPKALEGYAGGMTVGKYFLTQLKVMVTYIRLIFIPVHQRVEYDYPLATSIFELPVILSTLFLLLILSGAIAIFNKFRLIAFGIFWFFLTLLPESSIWPNQDVIFEHRLYLPMMGFCIVLSSGAFYAVGEKTSTLPIRILFLIVLACSVMTYQRNKIWRDEFTLWDDAVHQSPKCARAYLNRGAAYQNKGDLDHAMEDYNMVIGLGPITAVTLSNRGSIFRQKNEFDLALANFNLAININPNYAGTYINRGILYRFEGKFDLALADFNKAIEFIPNDANAYINRGQVYEAKGDLQDARADYKKGEILKKDR